jgi:hypothetical protein
MTPKAWQMAVEIDLSQKPGSRGVIRKNIYHQDIVL